MMWELCTSDLGATNFLWGVSWSATALFLGGSDLSASDNLRLREVLVLPSSSSSSSSSSSLDSSITAFTSGWVLVVVLEEDEEEEEELVGSSSAKDRPKEVRKSLSCSSPRPRPRGSLALLLASDIEEDCSRRTHFSLQFLSCSFFPLAAFQDFVPLTPKGLTAISTQNTIGGDYQYLVMRVFIHSYIFYYMEKKNLNNLLTTLLVIVCTT